MTRGRKKSAKKPAWDFFGIAKGVILGLSKDFNRQFTHKELPGFGL